MTTQLFQSGGVQTTAILPQVIYLDFDGELTRYNGELLTIDSVTVEDSGLTAERIAQITQALNDRFAGQNVLFVSDLSDLSDQSDYSTIYVGKTASFAPYGSFAGLAETVDSGNKIHNDNAFVILDSLSSDDRIADVIAHEAGHLLGTLDHGGEGLARYAQNYYISSGVTSTGVVLCSGDFMYVMSGGTANSTTVNFRGVMYVSSGGIANSTTFNNGCMSVLSGGTAINTIVNGTTLNLTGQMGVVSGGTANNTTVNSGGRMAVLSGGTVNHVVWTPCVGDVWAYDGAVVTYASTYSGVYFGSDNTLLSSAMTMSGKIISGYRCSMYVMSRGTANSTTINSNGHLYVSSGGTANSTNVTSGGSMGVFSGGVANSTTINSGGWMYVFSGGTANSTTVTTGGSMGVYSGGTAHSTIVNGGRMKVYSGGTHTGELQIADGAVVSAYEGAVIDFTLTDRNTENAALLNDLSRISGTPEYTITVKANQASGTYSLADGASGFDTTVTVQINGGEILGKVSLTHVLKTEYADYTLNKNDGSLTLTVNSHCGPTPGALSGTENGLSWLLAGAAKGMYSRAGSAAGIQFVTSGIAIDTYGVPTGTYDWKIAAKDSMEWVNGNTFTASGHTSPVLLKSGKNGSGDIFFADGSNVWESGYAAQHVGCGTWSGTGEQVDLAGKNQITDVFEGSSDANILVMTDDANGDALFVDDIYSAFPDEQQARIAQIDEIRAGAGDDMVDMTSQRFVYSGDGVTIRGGAGNDTIWANSGDNKLFGDAGNDRIAGASGNDVIAGGTGNDSMHGGGGDDIFCFCKGWGTDTVEQLTGGSVTLWFADNSGFWDQSTMTYTQGDNTVKVSGVTSVTLKFDDDGSELYDTLAAAGCFMAETSGKIWEESGKGVIAQL